MVHTYIVYGVYYKIFTCTFQYLNSHLSIKARYMAEVKMKCQCSLSFYEANQREYHEEEKTLSNL